MSDIGITLGQPNYNTQVPLQGDGAPGEAKKAEGKIISGGVVVDVMSGEMNRIGDWNGDIEIGKIEDVTADYTKRQFNDLEKLLALLGLDGENAKNATAATVLKSIINVLRAQAAAAQKGTMSAADMTALDSLKESLLETCPNDENAKKIIENIDRMHELETEIQAYADKGITFDPNNPPKDPPDGPDDDVFKMYTRVREMGDRIADITTYKGRMGEETLNKALGTNALAMRKQIEATLDSFAEASKSGWNNIKTMINYSNNIGRSLRAYVDVLKSPDLQFPPDAPVTKEQVIKLLEEVLAEAAAENSDADQIMEKLEKKLQEIQAQLDEVTPDIKA